jgi:hypothetical protein
MASMTSHQRRAGKTRNPLVVWLLSLVTLGIYQLYWYYQVNREAREYEPTVDVRPGIAVVAVTLGGLLIVPPWVSVFRTGGRIARAQTAAGVRDRCSGLLGLVLVLVFDLWVFYYQSQLNKVWARHDHPEPGTVV